MLAALNSFHVHHQVTYRLDTYHFSDLMCARSLNLAFLLTLSKTEHINSNRIMVNLKKKGKFGEIANKTGKVNTSVIKNAL